MAESAANHGTEPTFTAILGRVRTQVDAERANGLTSKSTVSATNETIFQILIATVSHYAPSWRFYRMMGATPRGNLRGWGGFLSKLGGWAALFRSFQA